MRLVAKCHADDLIYFFLDKKTLFWEEAFLDVIVVSIINIKDTRKAILHDPMNYTPTSIVEVFREYYTATDKKNVMTMTIQDGDSKRKLKLSCTLSTVVSI